MTKGLLFAIFFLLTVGALYTLLREDRRLAELARPKENVRLYRVEAPPPPVARATPAASPPAQPTPNETQNRLAIERARLEEIGGNLQALQAQQTQAVQQGGLEMMSRIDSNRAEIENLTDLLQAQRLALADVDRAADESLRDQSSLAQAARDQIDANIRILEEGIQQSQAQIFNWRWNSINIGQQQEQLAYWQGLLAEQTQQLQDLRLQRASVSAGVIQQVRSVASQTQQNKESLLANAGAIQDEIASLRRENVRLQTTQAQARQSSASLIEQIRQERQNYQEQQRKISELESASAR